MKKDKTKLKIPTAGYKGTRDFYPEQKFVQNYIFKVWNKVCKQYGYQEYGASILEPLDLYKAKSGTEIASEQAYSFEDKGGRTVTIRPEMTPTVSRMVAARRQESGYPLRLFSMPNCMRYEQPQKGRLREFWQLNVDIFGVETSQADLEIIMVADRILKEFGAKGSEYEILVNDRRLSLKFYSDILKLNDEEIVKVSKLVDKKDKLGEDDFNSQALLVLKEDDKLDILNQFLNASSLDELPEEIKNYQEVDELKSVIEKLKEVGVIARFCPAIVRALDYYTGIVFEVFDKNPENNRSMFGGGRYDGLVSLFGVESLPVVGFGMGDATLENFLESNNLIPKFDSEIDVCLIPINNNALGQIEIIAESLREQNKNVSVDFNIKRKLEKRINAAKKNGVKFYTLIGDKEINTEEVEFIKL